MPQPGSILGDIIETAKTESGKVVKETATGLVKSINILEGLDPVNPQEVIQKSQEYKAKDEAKLARVRSQLHQEVSSMRTAPKEQARPDQGAAIAEKGQINQNSQMNNSAAQLSAGITPKKKIEPLVVQQKRQNKLHGAG